MGVSMRKMMRSHVIVVFGATSRTGKATIEELTSQHKVTVTVVAAVENVKDARARRLKKATNCFLVKCNFGQPDSIQRVVRNADAVLLVPALSESGTRFSKRVIDAVHNEQVPRLVIISSILATNDFWQRQEAPPNTPDLGYEAVEAYARARLNNCVSLRTPMLMETIMYCREEIMFANRFYSCFDPGTAIPCIAVKDVAIAASAVLSNPMKKYETSYCLANALVKCSPRDIEQFLSKALGKHVKYHQISDDHLVHLLREKGATEYVAQSMVRLKNYLEVDRSADRSVPESEKFEKTSALPAAAAASVDTKLSVARFGYTNDFRHLTNQELTTPTQWLEIHAKQFLRTPQNQMQLFVIGSGEGLFVEVERFLAHQVTAPTMDPIPDAGEAAIPTSGSGVQQSKVTFCTVKSAPPSAVAQQSNRNQRDLHYYQVAGLASSPMRELLKQLTSLDVVIYIPPLRLGPYACMEVTKSVVDAAGKANAWGIVVVSTIFIGQGWDDSVNRMGEMEKFIEKSGVPYVIVRFPLFMEYFLALSSGWSQSMSSAEGVQPATDRDLQLGDESEEKRATEVDPTELQQQREQQIAAGAHSMDTTAAATSESREWVLSDRSLPTSRQYLIAMTDAAKALVAIAYTFPLHRNRVRSLYTECKTMEEIEDVLQTYAYKHRRIDFSRIDGLHEEPEREFWKVAYWTKTHVKQFLECSVALSALNDPIPMSETFEDVTECLPISLEKWAHVNYKGYTRALTSSGS
uniref:NmrA-like domain-containing protein n=1 Tax=Globisporangium ultimum (strain ATCC 200006 / CBS 805.95 / DAOM BR144) TaxID=431595 RepID=K3X315_GLOUD